MRLGRMGAIGSHGQRRGYCAGSSYQTIKNATRGVVYLPQFSWLGDNVAAGGVGAVLCDLGDEGGGAEGMKTRTPSELTSRAIVFGTVLVLLLSNVSGSVGVGAGVVGAPPTGASKV